MKNEILQPGKTSFNQAANKAIDLGATHYTITQTFCAPNWCVYSYSFLNASEVKDGQTLEVGYYTKDMQMFTPVNRYTPAKFIGYNLKERDTSKMLISELFTLNRGIIK